MKTKVNKLDNKAKGSNPFFTSQTDSFFSVQPKLKVGEPDDEYEKEADRVADQVTQKMSGDNTFFNSTQNVVQGQAIAETISPFIQKEEEEEAAQTQPLEEEEEMLQTQTEDEEEEYLQPQEQEEEEVQPKRDISVQKTEFTENNLSATRGNGNPINKAELNQMEHGFGADFGNVKIHTDSTAVQMNRELGARAFTSGNNIYFNSGAYRPETEKGRKLLAHELTHTIQQGASQISETIQREDESDTGTVEAGTESTTCDEATEREKQTFIGHGMYGPQSLSPSDTRTGGFEASYEPNAGILQITVRGKTRFVEGLEVGAGGLVTSHESDLSSLARLLNYIGDDVLSNTVVSNYYTWNETQKETARNNFRDRISDTISIWQDQPWLMFRVDKPCWDDITATVNITIDVQSEGSATYIDATNSGNDHLQVTLVKNPERSEFRAVRNLIQTTAERIGNERMETIDTSAGLTTGASVHSSRRGGGRNENPYDSEMTLSNLSLQSRPGEARDFTRSMLKRSVFFDNNQSELDDGDRAVIRQFRTDFAEADTDTSNSVVTLVGHASRAGTTAYNRRLVNRRLNAVMNYMREIGFPNINTRVQQENRSDTMAERYDDTERNAAWFRSVEILVGTGELQNTVAHEFGHVFGLLDEYATEGTSFTGTGTAPGTEVRHSGMSEAIGAGRVQSENSDNIMSVGNEVRAQHYGPFGWALRRLTGKTWEVY